MSNTGCLLCVIFAMTLRMGEANRCRCDTALCPCDQGPLCPPPPFPDLVSVFQRTLDFSASLGNLSLFLRSGLATPICKHSPLTPSDWLNFNDRLCSDDLEPYELESYSDRYLPAPGLFSEPPAYESAREEDDDVDSDPQPIEEWMIGSWGRSTASNKLGVGSDPEASGWSISRELVSTISVGCVILVSLTALIIFCFIRCTNRKRTIHKQTEEGLERIYEKCAQKTILRHCSQPKYDTPQEELHCLRWMPPTAHHDCSGLRQPHELIDGGRIPADFGGHPIKRYL